MMVMTPLILLVSLLFLLYKYVTRHFDHWKKKNVFYIKPIPFFGNCLDIFLFRVHQGPFLANLYRQTKEPFFGMFVCDTPHLVVRSPELVKAVLVKDFKTFDDRTLANPEHDPMTSHMLLTVKNPEWKIIRTKMTPVFTSGKLKAMFPLMSECGEEMTAHLAKQHQTGAAIEAKEICAKYTTDVIAKCAFGIDAGSFEREDAAFRSMGRLAFDFRWKTAIHQTAHFYTPAIVNIFKLHLVDPEVMDFMRSVFWETIRKRETDNVKRNDLIDALIKLKNNEEFSKEMKFEGDKVVSQAAQFYLAGFETTSATMAYTLYELCIHPQIQERLRREIQSVVQAEGLTYEAIHNMPYLHMCVSETLRKYPVLPFLDRRCNADYKLPGSDVVIEKGTSVYVSLFGLHYDPEYWPDPDKYDPERFSEENLKNIVPYTYIPFGEGPRICIGERFGMMGTKLGLIKVLSEYQVDKTPATPLPVVFQPKGFVLASKFGLPMKFTKSVICAA